MSSFWSLLFSFKGSNGISRCAGVPGESTIIRTHLLFKMPWPAAELAEQRVHSCAMASCRSVARALHTSWHSDTSLEAKDPSDTRLKNTLTVYIGRATRAPFKPGESLYFLKLANAHLAAACNLALALPPAVTFSQPTIQDESPIIRTPRPRAARVACSPHQLQFIKLTTVDAVREARVAHILL